MIGFSRKKPETEQQENPEQYLSKIKNKISKKESLRFLKSQRKDAGNKARLQSEKLKKLEKSAEQRNRELFKAVKREAAPKTAQQTIKYKRMFEDGICEIQNGFYSRSIKFSDINYQIARREDQVEIFSRYCEALNYFDPSIYVQISIISRHIDKDEFRKNMFMRTDVKDGLDEYRGEMNDMLNEKALEGQNSILREKYLTFSTPAATYEASIAALARIETDILSNFKSLGCETKTMSGMERLEVIHSLLQPGERFTFTYDYLVDSSLTTKDFITPSSFDFREKNMYEFGEYFGQTLFLKDLPPDLSDELIKELSDIPCDMTITLHLNSVEQDKALAMVKQKISFMEQQKIDEKMKLAKTGVYDDEMLSYELRYSHKEATELLDDLQNKNQRMFKVTVLIQTYAKDLDTLNDNIYQIMAAARKKNCKASLLDYLQEEGMNSSLPLGKNHVEIQRTLTTASTAIFVPFTTQELFQKGGLYYGLNALSRNLIFLNRKTLMNSSGFILGTPGCFTGDTMFALENGEIISLQDACTKAEPFKIKSYDIKQQKSVISTARNPRMTKQVSKLLKISFDTGMEIKCTHDHLFVNGDNNGFIEAQNIMSDEMLVERYGISGIVEEKYKQKISLYDVEVDEYEIFQLENGMYVHNSGKSFAGKREIANVLLNTDDEVVVIDPEREYTTMAEKLGGEVVHISAGSKTHINPLDITMDYADNDDPLLLKSEFILSLCDLIAGGKHGFESAQMSIIGRVCTLTYQEYLTNPKNASIPTLQDFYRILKEQPEQEAQAIALSLELYVKGNLSVFAQPTNINVNNRFVVYDIRDLGKKLKTLGMLIVLDQIWNRITQNRAVGRRTWIYIDEIYLLFQNEYSAQYLFELYKRARKWGAIPTGITQNVEDLLLSDQARRMLSNSNFIMMLNQAAPDRAELAGLLNISNQQLNYVTNASAGQGLIFAGTAIVPFIDKFPTDTQLYRMMTTKIEEIAKQREQEEAERAELEAAASLEPVE